VFFFFFFETKKGMKELKDKKRESGSTLTAFLLH